MDKKGIGLFLSGVVLCASLFLGKDGIPNKETLYCKAAAASAVLPQGYLAWHSYTSYEAMDSLQYVQLPDGTMTPLQGDFIHAMNADFGSHPFDLVFMAIDAAADEWDLYRCNLLTGKTINLTQHSGYRNEDPKFSPDGMKIVFKRGRWSHENNSFVYDLAEMDLYTQTVTMLTDSDAEESMPYYAADGNSVYYALQQDGLSSIWQFKPASGEQRVIYAEDGVTAYYPVVGNDGLYFTKWYSDQLHNDCIMRLTADGAAVILPHQSEAYNCSDPFPMTEGLLYSSSEHGSYDLCYSDGSSTAALPACNTDRQELGAVFYPSAALPEFGSGLCDYLLGMETPQQNYDVDGNGVVNGIDLTLWLRMMLLYETETVFGNIP